MASQSNWRRDDAGREWRGSSGERGRWRGSGRGRGFGETARGREGSWRSGGSVACGRGYVDSGRGHRSGRKSFERSQETAEEIEIRNEFRNNYNSWKRLIKSRPLSNDIRTIQILWQGALEILDGHDRDSKQMLARDLENDDFHGREHIRVILEMTTNTNGATIFLELVRPFLYVITHQALLDCLSIDTCVGDLYNFISGSNGSRAMPFFQRLMASLLETHKFADAISKENIERTMIAMSTCLRELVRREQRVLFHDDIPGIVTSLENSVGVVGVDRSSAAFSIIPSRTQELRGMIARANGLLYQEDQTQASGVSTTVIQSTYPRDIILPNGRHDNDKMDITDIRVLPTEDEIRSEAVEFLPSTDPDQPHFLMDSAARLLDTHFRLLRHDIFGELKSALGDLILTIEAQPSVLADSRLNLTDIRAHSYMNAYIANITFDHRRGLEVRFSFSPPAQLAKKSQRERRKWWEESKRLSEGVLLCLLSFNGTKCSPLFLTVTQKPKGLESDYSLVSRKTEAFITAKLATQSQQDFESLMLLNSLATEGVLIELPSVILATFTPILENLQYMQRLNRLPFRQWILPDRRGFGETATMDVPPPLYARGMRFTYSLKSILNDGAGEDLRIGTSRATANDAALIDEIERRTELDRGQSEALLAALQREFCHIQGPPGTGKSFLGVRLVKVLLDCRAAKLGPIIIVCYTNHALDQFLEHLIQSGIEKVIRVGGRSKSDILAGKNLRVVSQGENTTRSESGTLGATYAALKREGKSIQEVLLQLDGVNGHPSWKSVKGYLALKHPRIYMQFSRFDEDGYETVGGEPFDLWLKHNTELPPRLLAHQEAHTIEDLLEFASFNVHGLHHDEKLLVAKFLAEAARKDLVDELFESNKQTEEFRQTLKNVYSDIDRRVLQTADIIGVTTTGLATKISTLRHVNAKVIVCEEAGEVLESHMLSALLPSVEHVVSIGDHEQLRPSINNHNLSLESHSGAPYQLDRSQFERLSVGDPGRLRLPVAQLNIQRRMRPGISRFIKKIYPRLVDHDVTKALPNVVGMQENIFWLHHDNLQDNANGDETNKKSHSNTWEVEMTAALVRHIVRQGAYSSKDIAVLTPYSGQLQKLRLHMRKEFEIVLSDRDEEVLAKDGFIASDEELGSPTSNSTGDRKPLQKKNLSELLRIATVDNFQGEEAKVVIVSLMILRDGALKVVANWPATNAYRVVGINALLIVTRWACTKLSDAQNPANVFTNPVGTRARKLLAEKIVENVTSSWTTYNFHAIILKMACHAI
ncbi:hypothetical protein DSL72_000072 [Monilinia vaccinii-corymbosi]|uniref:Uncharacterized protein n=1 Tax=Monilinia vaccinii-corymbosi TaxID=61207 RepID=A0A8A3P867_9HELO|nr:hypothetical protein DSL72_000072 [Monilinia vaccinii-corymbosi]